MPIYGNGAWRAHLRMRDDCKYPVSFALAKTVEFSKYTYFSGPFRSFYRLNMLNNAYFTLISTIFESNTKNRDEIEVKHHSTGYFIYGSRSRMRKCKFEKSFAIVKNMIQNGAI